MIFSEYFLLQSSLTGLTQNELLEMTECLPPCTYHQYNVVSKEPVAEGFGEVQIFL